jgi:hypothetical protein
MSLFSSSSLAFDSFVSVISSLIRALNHARSSFFPLSCSMNSGVNSGFTDFSIFFTFTLKVVFLFANSSL